LHDSNVEDEDSTLNDSWTEYTESTVEDDVIHAGKKSILMQSLNTG